MIRLIALLLPGILLASSEVEQILAEMSLDEKIGQLFMAPACPLRDKDHWNDWTQLIEKYHIGNAILKHSDPITQVRFLNRLQDASPLPLLIAADAEWGLAMRMEGTIAFPKNRTLGAVTKPDLIYELGAEIGREAKRVGIHINLSPVADVNTNPANPVIGMRSFGEDPKQVASCVSAYVRGIQSEGVFACVKHFPGHGDTSEDSHRGLPQIQHSRKRLDQVEFLPFKQAIQDGVAAVMSGHLLVPSIDAEHPASLSNKCLTQVLQKELGFNGLIISDALNMKALTHSPQQIAIEAFQAGTDLLLYGDHIGPNIDKLMREDIPQAWTALKRGFEEGTLSVDRLNQTVLKILTAKKRLGLFDTRAIEEKGLLESLYTQEAIKLKEKLFQEAIVLKGELLPLPRETAYLSVGGSDAIASKFSSVFFISSDLDNEAKRKLERNLTVYKTVVIAIHKLGPREQNYGCSSEFLKFIEELPSSHETLLCLFATPYAIPLFPNQKTILIGFENDPIAQYAALKILRGEAQANGILNFNK